MKRTAFEEKVIQILVCGESLKINAKLSPAQQPQMMLRRAIPFLLATFLCVCLTNNTNTPNVCVSLRLALLAGTLT